MDDTIHIDQLSCEDCGCEFFKMYLTETAIYVPVCCDCGESMISLPAPQESVDIPSIVCNDDNAG